MTLKVIPRNTNWGGGRFYVPEQPNHLLESNCPKCGEMSISHGRLENAFFNTGKSDMDVISRIKFTCYGRGPTPDTDCDTEWDERIIIRVSIESV